jgi:hypothetical protein
MKSANEKLNSRKKSMEKSSSERKMCMQYLSVDCTVDIEVVF